MKNHHGFIELKTIQDYCKKLKFDYNELKSDNKNQYKAFNFIVTAYHLLDWLFKGKYNDPERKRINNETIIKVCSNIANGIKHFEVDPERHSSVKEIIKERYVEDGYVEDGYFETPIVIELDNEARKILGEKIRIDDFADRIITYWKNELSQKGIPTEL